MSAFEDFIQLELPRRPWVVDDPAQETVPVRRGAGPRQLDFISLNEGDVVGKLGGVIQGIPGTSLGGGGGGGGVPKSYIHVQAVATTQWNIGHAMSSEDVVVIVFDSTNKVIIPGEITVANATTVLIDFETPSSGKAVILFAS